MSVLVDSPIEASTIFNKAGLAQLGERQTEDLKVMCSIHINRTRLSFCCGRSLSLS
ncbi:hypothetical protein B0J13DRAFT_618380 [Dactylonectria estremocensis]|uniref:Uncharacterized protein n=1 Tax=Dactylonectria estremocensis TaxID=1079267 RepID=A0A9P9F699_9HYPO|nr:hypothetical protein B0J13DRAFT_618380 [Dactylonectria estremocensis]